MSEQEASPVHSTPKSVYEAPNITSLGSLADLTLGNGGPNFDLQDTNSVNTGP